MKSTPAASPMRWWGVATAQLVTRENWGRPISLSSCNAPSQLAGAKELLSDSWSQDSLWNTHLPERLMWRRRSLLIPVSAIGVTGDGGRKCTILARHRIQEYTWHLWTSALSTLNFSLYLLTLCARRAEDCRWLCCLGKEFGPALAVELQCSREQATAFEGHFPSADCGEPWPGSRERADA